MPALLHDLRASILALLALSVIAGPIAFQHREDPGQKAEESATTQPVPVAARPPLHLPSLLALSREITRLRRSVDYVGEIRMRSTEVAQAATSSRTPAVHLGGAYFAAPRDPALAPGTTSVLRLGKRLYRVRYLGTDRRFAGYYRLRDRAHIAKLPEPPLSTPKKREELGDLVLVVEGSSARLRLLSSWRMALPPVAAPRTGVGSRPSQDAAQMGQAKVQRLASWKSLEFYRLSEGGVSEAALVLALDGSLVGLVTTPALGKTVTATPKSADLQVVVDPRLLLRLAISLEAGVDKLPAPDPGLGVLLVRPIDGKGEDAKGFAVQELVAGGPGERSGVKAGDRWLAIDGKPLESFEQIRDILRGLEAGSRLEVRFRRGDGKSDTLWIRPD